jgi:hypothetical protein
MTLVREIADAVQLLAEVVRNTRDVVDAVNDGRTFLERRHPEAREDFAKLLVQMQVTVEGLSEVTKVVSGFRFEIREKTIEGEPARFNDYVISQKAKVTTLKGRIRELKADCEQVRVLRDALDAQSRSRSWGSMFGLVGVKGRRRATELASRLSGFYADDQQMIEVIQRMLKVAQKALRDVDQALGPPGMAYHYNVATAATLLQTYAVVFDEPQKELDDLVDALSDAATSFATSRPNRRGVRDKGRAASS